LTTRPHVLVAEDEVLAAMALEDFLTEFGYRVSVAHDGLKALEIDRADPADILLTDLRMPRMDGCALIHDLRKSRADLPIIVMTGYLSDEIGRKLDEANGPMAVLSKPVDPAEIHKHIQRLLDRVGLVR
jgi:CheY-like chemotaxis protein